MTRQLRFLDVTNTALLPGEIGVDLFAGGGGWSEGFQRATGVPPAVAVNHDADAIAMHTANHPETEHHHEDVFAVDPLTATRGRAVGWLHLSPDCTHFSRAKGSVPKSRKIRALAWVGVRWAAAVKPRILSLENVFEFTTWGPLHQQARYEGDNRVGTPNKKLAGTTFRKFIAALEALGYEVDYRVLKACDYGAPTSRKRLFVIARRDGKPIRWPEPTHGPGRAHPYRTAAECIDWTIPVPSIFDRKKPLADATLRRIAEGIRRYVLEAKRPFLVNLTHGGRVEMVDEPMATVTAAHRGEKALVAPIVTKAQSHGWDRGAGPASPADRPLGAIVSKDAHAVVAATIIPNNTNNVPQPPNAPLPTITTGNRNFLAAASLVQTGYGEREGQAPRSLDIEEPLGTVVAGGSKHAVCAAMLKHYGGVVGQKVDQPLGTITATDHHSVLACHLEAMYGNSKGAPVAAPLPTITAGSNHHGIVAASLAKYYGSDEHGQALDEPMHTIPTKDRFALVASFLTKYYGGFDKSRSQSLDSPIGTVTSWDHHGIVTVTIDGEQYAIADIGMRMLQPRELARAQGFPDSYVLTGTKTQQTARIGNSVPPHLAEAITRANTTDDVVDESEAAA